MRYVLCILVKGNKNSSEYPEQVNFGKMFIIPEFALEKTKTYFQTILTKIRIKQKESHISVTL